MAFDLHGLFAAQVKGMLEYADDHFVTFNHVKHSVKREGFDLDLEVHFSPIGKFNLDKPLSIHFVSFTEHHIYNYCPQTNDVIIHHSNVASDVDMRMTYQDRLAVLTLAMQAGASE